VTEPREVSLSKQNDNIDNGKVRILIQVYGRTISGASWGLPSPLMAKNGLIDSSWRRKCLQVEIVLTLASLGHWEVTHSWEVQYLRQKKVANAKLQIAYQRERRKG